MNINEITKLYITALENLIEIDVIYGHKSEMLLRGNYLGPGSPSEDEIKKRFSGLPGIATIESISPSVILRVRQPEVPGKRTIPWLNIILFLTTLIITLFLGALYNNFDFLDNPSLIWQDPLTLLAEGIPFSFTLLGILLFHEFGHYTASRLHGVRVTLPYFIPMPFSIIGTMGAIIKIKSPFLSRRQLFDVGAAGPLAGFVIAIPLAIWGISNPLFIPQAELVKESLWLGEPLIYTLIAKLVEPAAPPGYVPVIGPMAFAAWIGFLVTMMNLLPVGQLDGGHIIYAMFGKYQHKIAYAMLLALIILSFWWLGWLFWGVLVFIIIKPKHPPTIMDELPLDKKRMAIGYLCIAVFILCFIPVPFSGL